MERETFPGLLADNAVMMGYVDTSYWLDLGTPAAFVQGSADLVTGVAPTDALPGPTGEALVLPGAAVAAGARVSGGSTIGPDATVEDDAEVEASVLFAGARVGRGARVTRSVIGAGATIGSEAVVFDAVIGDGAVVGAGMRTPARSTGLARACRSRMGECVSPRRPDKMNHRRGCRSRPVYENRSQFRRFPPLSATAARIDRQRVREDRRG